MGILTLVLVPVVFFTTWICLAQLVRVSFPPPRHKRIGLLIAHPDDEAMFFSPTLVALTDPALKNHVRILCLCSGEDESLRDTRKSELRKSAALLGIASADDVTVIEDVKFPDSMTLRWDPDDVANVLSQKFAHSTFHAQKQADPGSPASDTADVNIDVLITFDPRGISSHANHISLYYGALHWLKSIDRAGVSVALYTLTTTNIVRKYSSLFDVPFSILYTLWQSSTGGSRAGGAGGAGGAGDEVVDDNPDRLLFLSTVSGYRRAQKAMTDGHVSQMLWFRWGWIALSRYISCNDLVRQRPGPGGH